MRKFEFDQLEETKEYIRYSLKYEGDLTLGELIKGLLALESEEYGTPSVTFYVHLPDGVNRMIRYDLDEEEEEYCCNVGNVFLTEYGHQPASCSVCENKLGEYYQTTACEYFVYIGEEKANVKYITKQDATAAVATFEAKDKIEEPSFILEDKVPHGPISPVEGVIGEVAVKEFIQKLLAKMDGVAPERREDCEGQTPWESYLLARDDMHSAIIEILTEG